MAVMARGASACTPPTEKTPARSISSASVAVIAESTARSSSSNAFNSSEFLLDGTHTTNMTFSLAIVLLSTNSRPPAAFIATMEEQRMAHARLPTEKQKEQHQEPPVPQEGHGGSNARGAAKSQGEEGNGAQKRQQRSRTRT
jgi:hypothetical protein